MKVLLSAFVCSPDEGSESGAGWQWMQAAASQHQVWALVGAHHRPRLDEALAGRSDLALTPVYLGPERLGQWALRRKSTLMLYYVIWQFLSVPTARRLQRQQRFDVLHHLTFASDSLPTGLALVPDVALVWGPVGGSTVTRLGLYRWLRRSEWITAAARDIFGGAVRQVAGRWTAHRSALIVAMNHDTARTYHRHPHVVEPNSAMGGALPARVSPREAVSVRTAVYTGRLIGFKGLLLALQAFSRPESAGWRLDIYGDGVSAKSLRRSIQRMGLEDRVSLHGQRPRTEVLSAVARADAFLFPSFHDSASWSVTEAVSIGCPVVCLDCGGPHEVMQGRGVCVPVAPARTLPTRLALALHQVPAVEPTDRWDARRLPALLSEWYELAGRRAQPSPRHVQEHQPIEAVR